MRTLKTLLIKIILISLLTSLFSCKRKLESVDIKLLLLNPENYSNTNISIQGKIKDIGPLNLWFVIEDNSGYIQVTTQNISKKINCLKKGQKVIVLGQLKQFGVHKYFSLQDNLKCE